MTLSMWMMADWLKDFDPSVQIQKGDRTITYARFWSDDKRDDPKALYVQTISSDTGSGILCSHQGDTIFLPDTGMEHVFNRILEAFSYYQDWEDRLNRLLKEHCRIEELLYASEEILTEPIFLLDSTHTPIALSQNYGPNDVDSEWKYMKETGTARMKDVILINERHTNIYKHKSPYHFTDPIFPNQLYQVNFFLQDQWIALANQLELHGPASKNLLECFTIFCEYVQLWFEMNSEQQMSQLLDTMLRDTFLGADEDMEKMDQLFQQLGWSPDSEKRLFLIKGINRTYNLNNHISKVIQTSYWHHYALTFNDILCDIFEIKNWESEKQDYLNLLTGGQYYACQSQVFQDFSDLKNRYDQAVITNEVCRKAMGTLYRFEDYAFPYAIHIMKKSVTTDLLHPLARELRSYDEQHNSELADTLYAYLLHERSMVKTAQALQIHKSTLVYRLKRISELSTYDLEDEDVRLHLIFSFRYLS